jgi:hypothetical protein
MNENTHFEIKYATPFFWRSHDGEDVNAGLLGRDAVKTTTDTCQYC